MTTAVERMLPLYEAKMIHHFDHRWATYDATDAIRDVTLAEKQDPHFVVQPRYWVREDVVADRLAGRWEKPWLLGWRDITNSTNERTTLAATFPEVSVGNNLPLMLSTQGAHETACLLANLSSYALDFAARLKVGGTHLNFFIYEQIPVLAPAPYGLPTPWQPETVLADWVTGRVLELTYTAWDMAGFARELGYDGPPYPFDPERRRQLRAELDGAFFHLYGIGRDDVDYIMDTFPIVRSKDEAAYGEYRTKRLILECFDEMEAAMKILSEGSQ